VLIKEPRSRVFGLDILRTCAIVCVLLVHSSNVLAPSFPGFPWIPLPDGVDLFFVLSGFLVGGMLLDRISENNGLDFKTLADFIQRRWFRTLPNYFLFLGVNILLVYFGVIQGTLNKYLPVFFVFLQNFHVPVDFLFWESWSLSIEEWFYLSFPILCFFVLKIRKQQMSRLILGIITVYVFAPLIYRMLTKDSDTTADHWDLFYRKLVLTRLDSIGFGVLAAFVKKYHSSIWTRSRYVLFVPGVLGLGYLSTLPIEPVGFFIRTGYFSLVSLCIAMHLPLLDSIRTERIPFKPFEFISKISYSVYFTNALVFQILDKHFTPSTLSERISYFVGSWSLIFLISWLIWKFFEYPLTQLRERISGKMRAREH
jgi:peptidoglycan/LPS O-acetylase OafA/YrhL